MTLLRSTLLDTHEGADPGASPHSDAQWKAMAVRGVWPACKRRCSEGKLARTWHPATAVREQPRPQCHLLAQTGGFVSCCRCGARAAMFAKMPGEPCVEQPRTQKYARSIRMLSSGWHPKTPTGERPIGLMPSIVRVWERMLKPILDHWMIFQSRPYDWACKGRSADMTAWQHPELEEGQDDKTRHGQGHGATGHDKVRSGSGTCGDGDAIGATSVAQGHPHTGCVFWVTGAKRLHN